MKKKRQSQLHPKKHIQWIQQLLVIRHNEIRAVFWAWLYIFSLFLSYYVLRPIRDDLGVAGGVHNLPWLFTGTLIAMIVINPLFSYVVKHWTRERFITITYRFFMLNLLVFYALLHFSPADWHIWIGRIFFIWVSVFNLFVISVFWSFVVDIFDTEQGKRLFGFLAAGATVGGICGAGLTSLLVSHIGQINLLWIAILLLELAVYAAKQLSRLSQRLNAQEKHFATAIIGGGLLTGLKRTFSSPYLLGIACFILLYSMTSTFLYFQQATIASQHFHSNADRTAFFAQIDFWVNTFTLIVQLFLTGKLLNKLGITLMLCTLPIVTMVGFSAFAVYPTILVFILVQVVRRVCNYGLVRPTREILFTSVSREDRYKAKNFIDTGVYRSGDQIASWTYAGVSSLGGMIVMILAILMSFIWLVLSIWLGLAQKNRQNNLL